MESCLSSVTFPCVTGSDIEQTSGESEAWFCVRTQPKHEHIAAAQLRLEPGIGVFLPRIRYRRSTRCGPAWVTEALFKDYVFARFDLATSLRRVQSSRAVRCVVHFGSGWPTIPDAAIAELKKAIGEQEMRVVEDTLQPGDFVQIASGAMHGLQAVVTRVMPTKQRVAVPFGFPRPSNRGRVGPHGRHFRR